MGLPHTIEEYKQAKDILLSTYGKDIKVHKAMIKEIEGLHHITGRQGTSSQAAEKEEASVQIVTDGLP